MAHSKSVLFIACDHGARAAVEPLASYIPGNMVVAATRADQHYWQSQLQEARLLICGTSDSAIGRKVEQAARIAAFHRAVPHVLIEDFPGNFLPVSAGRPGLLGVESEFAAQLAQAKQKHPLTIHIGPGIRYDRLRRDLGLLRAAQNEARDTLLWIGQPETEDALLTLEALIPKLRPGFSLWFRAHPRDEGYANGAYSALLEDTRNIVDMTARPIEECLRRRPRIVITQFSSVAVEAGFWGIPAVHVLLSEAGGARLLAKKGYALPPWCEAGAAFFATRANEIGDVLERAMRSERARTEVQERFDEYFKVREEGAPGLIDVLYNQGLL